MSIFKNIEEENDFCNTQCSNCMADMREDCNVFDGTEKAFKRVDSKVICTVSEPIPEGLLSES